MPPPVVPGYCALYHPFPVQVRTPGLLSEATVLLLQVRGSRASTCGAGLLCLASSFPSPGSHTWTPFRGYRASTLGVRLPCVHLWCRAIVPCIILSQSRFAHLGSFSEATGPPPVTPGYCALPSCSPSGAARCSHSLIRGLRTRAISLATPRASSFRASSPASKRLPAPLAGVELAMHSLSWLFRQAPTSEPPLVHVRTRGSGAGGPVEHRDRIARQPRGWGTGLGRLHLN